MVSEHSHALPRRVIKIAFNIYDDDSHASIIPREFAIRTTVNGKVATFRGLRGEIFQYLMVFQIWDFHWGRSSVR